MTIFASHFSLKELSSYHSDSQPLQDHLLLPGRNNIGIRRKNPFFFYLQIVFIDTIIGTLKFFSWINDSLLNFYARPRVKTFNFWSSFSINYRVVFYIYNIETTNVRFFPKIRTSHYSWNPFKIQSFICMAMTT